MQLKPTLARLLVSLGFLRLMDFVLRHSEQARSRFTYAKIEEAVVPVVPVQSIAAPRRAEPQPTYPPTAFNFYHRQRIIGE